MLTSARKDFGNPKPFRRGKDAIALTTGPLSAKGGYTLYWLTAGARRLHQWAAARRTVHPAHVDFVFGARIDALFGRRTESV